MKDGAFVRGLDVRRCEHAPDNPTGARVARFAELAKGKASGDRAPEIAARR